MRNLARPWKQRLGTLLRQMHKQSSSDCLVGKETVHFKDKNVPYHLFTFDDSIKQSCLFLRVSPEWSSFTLST